MHYVSLLTFPPIFLYSILKPLGNSSFRNNFRYCLKEAFLESPDVKKPNESHKQQKVQDVQENGASSGIPETDYHQHCHHYYYLLRLF